MLVVPAGALAQNAEVISAMSAGPVSVSYEATIQRWDGTVLREGSNGWTCLPDRPDTPGVDPWCADEVWMGFLHAMLNGAAPEYDRIGIAYMLRGDTPVSNVDPTATSATDDNVWVADLGPHLMMLVPGPDGFAGVSTDPYNGGPWVMFPDTPFAHLMIPITSYGK
jgi:hypothetical protein